MSQHDIDPIETLRAELSRVEVSPDFAERVRRQIGQDAIASIRQDAIASIGAELSELSVSPEFAVRVRQQIEEAPARSWWLSMFDWRWAVPVAAAAVIGAFVLTRGTAPTTPGVESAGVQARGPEQSAQLPQAPQTPSHTAATASAAVMPPSRIATALVNERTVPSAAASGQQAEDKLEVITNQPAILRELWAAAATAEAAEVAVEVRDLVIVPVEVAPVAVKWLVEPLPSGGVAPIIRRISADAERSDK
jgi:hypothetical protein